MHTPQGRGGRQERLYCLEYHIFCRPSQRSSFSHYSSWLYFYAGDGRQIEPQGRIERRPSRLHSRSLRRRM